MEATKCRICGFEKELEDEICEDCWFDQQYKDYKDTIESILYSWRMW